MDDGIPGGDGAAGDRWLGRVVGRIATRFWTGLSAAVGLIGGILSFLAGGPLGSILLRVVAVIATVFLLVLLANEFLVAERYRMKKRVAALGEERDRYRGILESLVDRQSLHYEEHLHLHAYIGAGDDGDEVVESHRTVPTPRLFYRSLRPIRPHGAELTFEDFDFELDLREAGGTQATLNRLRDNPPRLLIMFHPAVDSEIEWDLRYRSRGLWGPLRRTGVDQLMWDARTPSGRRDEFTFTSFAITFHFPPEITQARVTANVEGASTTYDRADGHLRCTWSYAHRVNHFLTWELAMKPVPSAPVRR